MKALTVQQPWAWAIVAGGKDVENRTQLWKHRGTLAIHAGTRVSVRGIRTVPGIIAAESLLMGADLARDIMLANSQVRGAIIGTVDVTDIHHATPEHIGEDGLRVDFCCESWWAETSYVEHGGRTRRQLTHLVLEQPKVLGSPIPCRGALGLWTVPHDIEALIEEQLR